MKASNLETELRHRAEDSLRKKNGFGIGLYIVSTLVLGVTGLLILNAKLTAGTLSWESAKIFGNGIIGLSSCFILFLLLYRVWPLNNDMVRDRMDEMREDILRERIDILSSRKDETTLTSDEEEDLEFYKACLESVLRYKEKGPAYFDTLAQYEP